MLAKYLTRPASAIGYLLPLGSIHACAECLALKSLLRFWIMALSFGSKGARLDL